MSNLLQDLSSQIVTLEGEFVRLEPLEMRHAPALAQVVGDPEIWRYMPTKLTNLKEIEAWIEASLESQAAGEVLPFATIDQATGQAIGSTRYLNIMPKDRGVEIGHTWLAKRAWRTAINTNCKYLLLQNAFEQLNCIRVCLKTDRRNERSRNAILGIGASFEGILRQHMILQDGTYRDTAYFSIIDLEWPAVKARLETRLRREN